MPSIHLTISLLFYILVLYLLVLMFHKPSSLIVTYSTENFNYDWCQAMAMVRKQLGKQMWLRLEVGLAVAGCQLSAERESCWPWAKFSASRLASWLQQLHLYRSSWHCQWPLPSNLAYNRGLTKLVLQEKSKVSFLSFSSWSSELKNHLFSRIVVDGITGSKRNWYSLSRL